MVLVYFKMPNDISELLCAIPELLYFEIRKSKIRRNLYTLTCQERVQFHYKKYIPTYF